MYKKYYFRQKRTDKVKGNLAKTMIPKFQSSKKLTNSISTQKPTEREKKNNTGLYNSKTIT